MIYTIEEAIEQLESCRYHDEHGHKLENNLGFMFLKQLGMSVAVTCDKCRTCEMYSIDNIPCQFFDSDSVLCVKPKPVMLRVRVGDCYLISDTWYILGRVNDKMALVSLTSGNVYSNAIKYGDSRSIDNFEFKELLGNVGGSWKSIYATKSRIEDVSFKKVEDN